MPFWKGLAVSIHTPDGPLPEYSIVRQSRQSRITSYIPVPPPNIKSGEAKAEPSTFAISITLLVPNQKVPYTGKNDDPESWRYVGTSSASLPSFTSERGRYANAISPYAPLTSSPNETVAAYIHFDGRAKEEVATLLRRGEETWVNSRWVSVPESEGGGLAEREFLFREVGLERWLNGLDLKGESQEVAAVIERRKKRLQKKQEHRNEIKTEDEEEDIWDTPRRRRRSPFGGRERVHRYGGNDTLENVSADESMLSSDTESDDDMPMPEAAGQIKISLYRVLASGEVKKGEYSPQFDAHDDDDDAGKSGDAEVDHTTTFAKPKTLDPKTISTQTVTGIDPPQHPYATFTFFYRGEKQLQKMGILPTPSKAEDTKSPEGKPKSRKVDFSNLGPLKAKGGAAFSGYRDAQASAAFQKVKKGKARDADEMDSDADDEDENESRSNGMSKDSEDKDVDAEGQLSSEELRRRAELAEGVKKIQLKRQHSAEDVSRSSPAADASIKPPNSTAAPTSDATNMNPPTTAPAHTPRPSTSNNPVPSVPPPTPTDGSTAFPSPFKKQRASVSNGEQLEPSPLSKLSSFGPPLQATGNATAGGRSSFEEVQASQSSTNDIPEEEDKKSFNQRSFAQNAQLDHHFKSHDDAEST